MGAYLSARQAARACGVSEKTVRNWIASGRISAQRSATGFRIDPDQLPHHAAESAQTSAESADQVRDLRAHVADLRTQLEVKDRQISELHTLLAQAQRALPAPDSLKIAPGRTPDNAAVETTQKTSDARPGRPWWRFWVQHPA